MHNFYRFIFAVILSLITTLSFAQTIGDAEIAQVEQLRTSIDKVFNDLQDSTKTDDELVGLAVNINALEQELIAQGVLLSPRSSQINTRLKQLGPAPADGEPEEPELISDERIALNQERAVINQLLGTLEDQSIRAKTALDRIAETRRDLFAGALSQRYDISNAFGAEFYSDITTRYKDLTKRISSWIGFTTRFKQDNILTAAFGVLILMLGAIWASRRTLTNWIYRDPTATEPTYFQRLTTAFWYTILPSIVLWLFFLLAYALLRYLDILRIDIAAMLVTLLSALGIVFLVWRLAEAIFSPTHANWRLLDISSAAARPLKAFVIIMVLVAALDYVTSEVNEIIGTSIPITIARSLVTSVVVGLMFLLIAFLRPFLSIAGMADEKPRPWPLIVKLALFLIGSVLIVTALAGYIGLARFMAQQLVVTGAVLTTMYLGYRTAHAISAEKALFGTRLGNRLANEMQFSETAVDQIGLVTGITMMAFVVVTGLPVLALLWGFQWADVRSFFVTFFTDIQIGSISLSITSILVGILLFAVGLFITRRFQRWLDGNVLARSGVDLGARNSISTIVLYIGVAVAGLLGVSAAGLQLSQLALVAGALSLGIGFGLQNIVSNFVSGLILLAERPFKSGDIIEAGGFTGVVKNIKVRATEVETFDKKTLILPNSELINSSVINWVHKTTLGRIEIPIGVGYDSDPQQVYTMLLDILNDHPRILSNPEPFVEFADFGASSLDFILRGYLADIGFGLTVRTELRMAIFERFKAAGIEIPFPQRDVNLKIVDGELKEVLPAKDSTEFGVIKTTNKRTLEGDDG